MSYRTLGQELIGLLFLAALAINFSATPAHAEELPKRLVVTSSTSWVPFAFLDEHGEPRGILIDIWRKFGERNDVEIIFELVNWSDSLQLVRDGKADVHAGLIETDEREEFMRFSQELLRVRGLLFIAQGSPMTDLADMGTAPVGIVASTYEQKFLNNHFPEIHTRTFASSEVMMKAAVDGEIQAFITDYPTGYYPLISLDSVDHFSARATLFTRALRAGVRPGPENLLGFIDSGFEKISYEERIRLKERWLIPDAPLPPWLLPLIMVGVALAAAGGLSAHYVSLQRTVRRRTADLNASIEELQLAKDELERLARMDPLTGLRNRGRFQELLEREIERTRRYSRPLSLMLLDLDHFKRINDQHGHLAGDEALKYFARTVEVHLRTNDVFARIGGEEFGMILPETRADVAVRITERILKDVRETPFRYDGQRIGLSFSAGISEYRGEGTADEVLKQADEALYQSKAEGRNQVRVHTASS